MMRVFSAIEWTEEPEDEAALFEDILLAKAQSTARDMAKLMASKGNRQLFGETEFLLRDAVQRLVGWELGVGC